MNPEFDIQGLAKANKPLQRLGELGLVVFCVGFSGLMIGGGTEHYLDLEEGSAIALASAPVWVVGSVALVISGVSEHLKRRRLASEDVRIEQLEAEHEIR